MGQTRTIPVTFTGGEQRELPGGRFLFIKSATGALDVELAGVNGTPSVLQQIGAGSRVKRLDGEPWRYTRITSAIGQTIVIVLSDDAEFDVANTVTVSGAVSNQELPSSAIAVTASGVLATGASLDIAANPARRRITICNDSSTGNSVWVRDQSATANAGIELQSGQSVEMRTTAALRVRNNSGGNANISTLEET